MKIETAVKRLFEYHQKALLMNVEKKVIQNPVAWALYKTWREAGEKEGKDAGKGTIQSDHPLDGGRA